MRKSAWLSVAVAVLFASHLSSSSLEVTTVARHTGMFGLDIVFDGAPAYLKKLFAPDGPFRQLGVRTYLDVGAMSCPLTPCAIDVLEVHSETAIVARVSILEEAAGGRIRIEAFLNDGSSTSAMWATDLSDWLRFQINVITASAPGALNGRIDVWINGGLGVMIPSLDNDQRLPSQFWMGAIGRAGTEFGRTGFMAFDNVAARSDGAFINDLADFLLTVTKSGTGDGIVSSSPPGIDCGPTCSAVFPADSTVTLQAVPALGSMFSGWSGDCAAGGPGSSPLVMLADRECTATFDIQPPWIFTEGFEGGAFDEWDEVVE